MDLFVIIETSNESGGSNSSELTQKRAVATGYVRRYVAKLLLGVIIPEDESILAEPLLGLAVHASVIKIALFRIGEETLELRATELRLAQGRQNHQWQKTTKNHVLSRHPEESPEEIPRSSFFRSPSRRSLLSRGGLLSFPSSSYLPWPPL